MLRRRLWGLVALPWLLWSQASFGFDASRSATLDAMLQKAAADSRVSAISALVVRADGEVLYQGVAGRLACTENRPGVTGVICTNSVTVGSAELLIEILAVPVAVLSGI